MVSCRRCEIDLMDMVLLSDELNSSIKPARNPRKNSGTVPFSASIAETCRDRPERMTTLNGASVLPKSMNGIYIHWIGARYCWWQNNHSFHGAPFRTQLKRNKHNPSSQGVMLMLDKLFVEFDDVIVARSWWKKSVGSKRTVGSWVILFGIEWETWKFSEPWNYHPGTTCLHLSIFLCY